VFLNETSALVNKYIIVTMRVSTAAIVLFVLSSGNNNVACAFSSQHPQQQQHRSVHTHATASSSMSFVAMTRQQHRPISGMALQAAQPSQLEQLASMTTLSIDSGDLNVVQQYADTGFITDATTNPLFVSQAGTSDGNPMYAQMIVDAVEYAVKESGSAMEESDIVGLAMERLSVNLGAAIAKILVNGYISTEVDPRLSFDTQESIKRGLRIIAMYESMGVPKERVLIKLAATWEGILAAEVLERDHGIQCNLTLVFSMVQAVACAQRGAHLISPFPGRVLDWNNARLGRPGGVETPQDDEGVILCSDIFNYYKVHNHKTICMPASWRPSRGPGDHALDEIVALAGSDRMTIPAPLLEKLAASTDALPQMLSLDGAKSAKVDEDAQWGGGMMDEQTFRLKLNMDGCGTDKLAEGLRAFIGETDKLEAALQPKVRDAIAVMAAATI
jgi:transaldolase